MQSQKSIEITDGESTVVLLPGIKFDIEHKRICKKQTMASGLTVIDVVGHKNVLTIPTGWLSSAQLNTLVDMIKYSPCLTVKYPYLTSWREELFLFEVPKLTAFKYDEDGAECLGVTLEAEQVLTWEQEPIEDSAGMDIPIIGGNTGNNGEEQE